MAAESGHLTMAFDADKAGLSALGEYIAGKLSSLEATGLYLRDEVCEWSFLEGWSENRGELISQLITYDSINCAEMLCRELIQRFPSLGFGGTLYHDWTNSESSPTQITFMHEKDTQILFWYSRWWDADVIQEAFDDSSWSGNIYDLPPTKIIHWRWNAANDKKKILPETPTQDYYVDYLFQSQNPRG